MKKLKQFLFIILLLELLFSYTPAFAQINATSVPYGSTYSGVQSGIEQYLCAPTSTDANNLYTCINKLYKFAIIVASVMSVFFIVIAGYVYMSAEGNSESVEKAKSILTSSIASLVILFAGYILLKALNPDLIQFQTIQPPNVTLNIPAIVAPTTGGNAAYPNGVPVAGTSVPSKSTACTVDTGFNCSQAAAACAQYSSYIQQYAGMINDPNVNGAALLQTIMYHESRCQNGLTSGAAYGLMQMVLSTANNSTLKSKCGINVTIDANWFNSNPGPSICLAAAYLNNLTPSCGSNMLAYY